MKQFVPSLGKMRQLFFDRSVISWLAMAISITSFYLTVITPAELHVQPGQSFQVWHNDKSELQIDYPLSFSNTGAKIDSVLSLALIIRSDTMKEAMLCKWGGIQAYDNGWKFVSRERPISLVPKATADEVVNFTCGEPGKYWVPASGNYKFTFLAWTGHQKRYDTRVTVGVKIDEVTSVRIEKNLEDGNSIGTWVDGNALSGRSRLLDKKALETILEK